MTTVESNLVPRGYQLTAVTVTFTGRFVPGGCYARRQVPECEALVSTQSARY
jgi:hypothetical protein